MTLAGARVLVVGDVVDDIVVRPLSAVTHASDTDAEIRMLSGGCAANVAAWLGWLGTEVTFVGRAGVDGVERHAAAQAAHGVRALIAADPQRRTATIVLTLDGEGERTMYVDRGANAALRPGDVPDAAWEGVGVLHLTGYTSFDPATRPTALALLAEAGRRGVVRSVDPSSVGFLAGTARGVEDFLGWTAGCEQLLPNLDEGRLLAGLDPSATPDQVLAVLAGSYAGVTLTCGSGGALTAGPQGRAEVAADPTRVVDTTGAGDAFAAGWLAALVAGAAAEDGLALGARTAATAVARVGARPPSP